MTFLYVHIISPKFVSIRKVELTRCVAGTESILNRRSFTGKNPGTIHVKSLRSRARQKIRKTTFLQLLPRGPVSVSFKFFVNIIGTSHKFFIVIIGTSDEFVIASTIPVKICYQYQ
jgi:hypothetical protein